jgi:uncharacterized protein Veg
MMVCGKLKFEDLDAFNGMYVEVEFNNGQINALGRLKTLYSTLFVVEQSFDNIKMDCQYDMRDVQCIQSKEETHLDNCRL